MKFIIFFIIITLVSSELHTFITTYTGIKGQNESQRIPEFSSVSTLDEQQIDYYDSNTMKLILRQKWMEEFTSELWKKYTAIREHVQQVNNITVHELMERFNQTDGFHTFQRMYGCDYKNKTSHEFDEYGYDGEDFISLDLKKRRYTASVPQAKLTVMKWNKNKKQLELFQQYLQFGCHYWLDKFRHFSKATFEKADPPKVSLLQKNPGNYMCHVTGFLFRNTTISWRKNGRDINSFSELVKSKDTLPNGDGTFQRTLTLHVNPDDLKKSQYTCVVEHQSLTEPVQKILTVNETRSDQPASDASYNTHPPSPVIIVIVVAGLTVLIGLCVFWKHIKKLKDCSKKTYEYVKNPEPEHTRISNPSEENVPSRKTVNHE